MLDYEQKMDSLLQRSEILIEDDSAGQLAEVWVNRAEILNQINEKSSLKEKYKNIDFQTDISKAWNKALILDKKREWIKAIETGLAASAIDLCNSGLEALENARQFKSVGDAEKAEESFRQAFENYKKCGKQQPQVDEYWRIAGYNWKWVKFYRGLALRLSQKHGEAESEYISLVKLEWKEPILHLELADLQEKTKKNEESLKTLTRAHEFFPAHVSIACALTRAYLVADKLKPAMAIIKKFDSQLGNQPELVLTKALVYEKKGDLKKADALFKALYQFDKFEVHTNVAYAAYLMRKTQNADKMDAQEFAQLAFNLIEKASELSPNNEDLKFERDAIKFKFPKVYREEEF